MAVTNTAYGYDFASISQLRKVRGREVSNSRIEQRFASTRPILTPRTSAASKEYPFDLEIIFVDTHDKTLDVLGQNETVLICDFHDDRTYSAHEHIKAGVAFTAREENWVMKGENTGQIGRWILIRPRWQIEEVPSRFITGPYVTIENLPIVSEPVWVSICFDYFLHNGTAAVDFDGARRTIGRRVDISENILLEEARAIFKELKLKKIRVKGIIAAESTKYCPEEKASLIKSVLKKAWVEEMKSTEAIHAPAILEAPNLSISSSSTTSAAEQQDEDMPHFKHLGRFVTFLDSCVLGAPGVLLTAIGEHKTTRPGVSKDVTSILFEGFREYLKSKSSEDAVASSIYNSLFKDTTTTAEVKEELNKLLNLYGIIGFPEENLLRSVDDAIFYLTMASWQRTRATLLENEEKGFLGFSRDLIIGQIPQIKITINSKLREFKSIIYLFWLPFLFPQESQFDVGRYAGPDAPLGLDSFFARLNEERVSPSGQLCSINMLRRKDSNLKSDPRFQNFVNYMQDRLDEPIALAGFNFLFGSIRPRVIRCFEELEEAFFAEYGDRLKTQGDFDVYVKMLRNVKEDMQARTTIWHHAVMNISDDEFEKEVALEYSVLMERASEEGKAEMRAAFDHIDILSDDIDLGPWLEIKIHRKLIKMWEAKLDQLGSRLNSDFGVLNNAHIPLSGLFMRLQEMRKEVAELGKLCAQARLTTEEALNQLAVRQIHENDLDLIPEDIFQRWRSRRDYQLLQMRKLHADCLMAYDLAFRIIQQEGLTRDKINTPEYGSLAILLRYMFENNAKRPEEISTEGIEDAFPSVSIYYKIDLLERVGLVEGGKGSPRSVPDDVRNLGLEAIIDTCPELKGRFLTEDKIAAVRNRIGDMITKSPPDASTSPAEIDGGRIHRELHIQRRSNRSIPGAV